MTSQANSIVPQVKSLQLTSSTCNLIVGDLEESSDMNVKITADKNKLTEKSSYFSGIFASTENDTVKVNIPYPHNFIECILPTLDKSIVAIAIEVENCIETLRNARYLGLPNIYHFAVETLVEKMDRILTNDKFNPKNIKCEDIQYVFKYTEERTTFQSNCLEQQLIWKLEVLLSWVDGYPEDKTEIKEIFDKYVEFSCCVYNGELCWGLNRLRKKYPVAFFQYLHLEGLLDLSERSQSKKYMRVSSAGVLEVNGAYIKSGEEYNGKPVFVLKRNGIMYALYSNGINWCISSCDDISGLQHGKVRQYFYHNRNNTAVPGDGWTTHHAGVEPPPIVKLVKLP